MSIVLQIGINTLVAGSIIALLAAGFSLVYATTRVLHLPHGVGAAFAGYMMYTAQHAWQWPFVLSLCVALASAVGWGLLLEVFFYAPLRRRKASGLGLLVAAIALLIIGVNALLAVFSAKPVQPALAFSNEPIFFFGAFTPLVQLLLIITTAALFCALWFIMKKTKFGVSLRATADNAIAAQIVGIPTQKIERRAAALAAFLGGAAGVLISFELTLVPEIGTFFAIKAFAASVIGGVGSVPGAILGGFIFGSLDQAAAWFIGKGWQDAISLMLIFIFLIVRPQGLCGRTVRRDDV
jgi:branched-chain amino acid transport system permease protein